MNYKLSILLPGIRTQHWNRIYNETLASCNRHNFEMIFCSHAAMPKELKEKSNVKMIEDAGCPSRCLQHASTHAEGEFIAIMSDDGIVLENSLSDNIDLIERSGNPNIDIVALRYTEGQNFKANPSDFDKKYWHAKYHGDLRLDGIEDDWKICLMFLMNTERFRYLGGIDCRFEHFNCNLHDLAFRAQRDGSKIIISESFVTAQDWEPNRDPSSSPIIQAYYQNDKPLLESIYRRRDTALSREIRISYDNWKEQPAVWPRRR